MMFTRHVFLLLLMGSSLSFANNLSGHIIPADTKVRQLATGMKFTEGPVWLPQHNTLIFSDIPDGMLMQWSASDGLKPFQKVQHANGNILDSKGRILTCQHAGRNVIRTEKDGSITTLARRYNNKRFNSPNDLAQHRDGSVWFTDPSYGLRGRSREYAGQWVFRLDPHTRKTTPIYKGFDMPNGIVFSPDYRTVYISNTGKNGVIRAFLVDGKSIHQKPLREIPIRSDGMCVDTEGNIYTTTQEGIHVIDPAGKTRAIIPVPEHPANVCFGSEHFDTLFITARTSLYSIKTLKKGMR